MKQYDVVIVGAGPAGLKCAEVLGGSALSVLLLEKNEVIGPKVCAGGLTGKDIEYLNLPSHLVEHSYKSVEVHVNSIRKTIAWDTEFAFTIDRKEFGQWQLAKLKAFPNVEIRTNARASKIADNQLEVNGEVIGFRYLVGADGSNSIVRRSVGLTGTAAGIGMQYIVPTDEYKKFEFFFQPKYFSAWYAWIFPHKNYVSIGCGASLSQLKAKELHQNFHAWLKERSIDVSGGRYEQFPMNYDYYGMEFGNVFLTGDAAGLLSSFTGEGIYQALISGEEVARKILSPSYNFPRMPELLHKHRRHRKVLDLLINAGRKRIFLFFGGLFLFNFRKYCEKAINLLG